MTISITQPTDQELNARWPYWIRTLATALNALELGSTLVVTNLVVDPAATMLVVGTDLSAAMIELILITSAGTPTINIIRSGVSGQIKIFMFQDSNISMTDGAKSDGKLYLNQLPALTDFAFQQGDVVTLVNIGGDGSVEFGYWKEIWRQNAVK